MQFALSVALLALSVAVPAQTTPDLEEGLAGALRGCEEWVLNPISWAEGFAPFVAAVGLGDRMGRVERVEEVSLPPPDMRRANHYWRINATTGAGFVLVVSDRLPMCHITGGGNVDLQPSVQSVLATNAFTSKWEPISEDAKGDMKSSVFRNRREPALTIVISRAKAAGQRLDRVQVIATAVWKTR